MFQKYLVKMRMNKNKKVHSENISPQFVAHAGQHYELSSFRAEIELEKKSFLTTR